MALEIENINESDDLVFDIDGDYIGSAYSPQVDVTETATGHEVAITYKDAVQGITTKTFDVDNGADGYSPIAKVTQGDGEATITITDKDGTTTATVHDGQQGEQGPAGYSPTVSIVSTPDDHTVTITDAEGPHSYTVPTYADEEQARADEWAALKTDVEAATDAANAAAEAVQPQISRLLGNILKGELSGTIDTASDAYAAPPMALAVEGSSTQVTTTGKNLWDDSRYASVGWSLVTGSMYHGGIKAFCDGIADLGGGVGYPESTQVTICLDIVRTGSTGSIKLRFDYTDGTSSDTPNISGTSYHKTYTSDAGKTVSAARITTTAGALNASFWFGHIQVGVGVNPSAYETYSGGNASPSPDYSQEIASVGNPSMVLCGKNLLDPSSIEQGGILAGDNFAYANRCRTNDRMPIRAGSDIVLTGSSSSGTLEYAVVFYKRGIFETINGTWIASGQAITVPSNVDECRFTFHNSDDSDIAPSDLSNIQLELGSTATAYEPYTGTTVPDLLPEGTELRSLPDGTKDTLALTYLRPSTREGWAWYSRELVQTADVLDLGARTWTAHATREHVFYASMAGTGGQGVPGGGDVASLLCTELNADSYSHVMGGYADNIVAYASTTNILYAYSSAYNTAADFKAAMSGAMLQYKLATYVTTQLDPIELPALPAPNFTVWCDGGSAQPTFRMTYERNLTMAINAIETAIADQ